MAVAAAPLPPPAIVSPAPREVSYGRIEGRVPAGTRQVLVRVGGTVLATKDVRRRRFVVVVSLPSRDVTIRVTAVDALGRRSSTLVGPVYGLPREAAPYAGPIPALRGYEDAALARATRSLARRFPGVCGFFVQDLRTGAGAAWNARARFPAASTLKLAIAVELMRSLRGIPQPGSRLAGLLWRMLVYSDDRSANELLAAIGGSISGGSARVELDDARAQPRRQRDVRRLHRRGLALPPADPARDPRPPVLHRQVHDRLGPGPPRAGAAPGRGRARRPGLALPAARSPRRTRASSSTCSRTRGPAAA